MRNGLALVVLLLGVPALAAQQSDSVESLGEAFQLAGKASAAGDWKATRAALQAALRFSPENPAVLYNLARAEARLGNRAAAVQMLDRLVRQGAARRVEDDTAFAPIRGSREFSAVARRLADDQSVKAGTGEQSVVLRMPLENACGG